MDSKVPVDGALGHQEERNLPAGHRSVTWPGYLGPVTWGGTSSEPSPLFAYTLFELDPVASPSLAALTIGLTSACW